MNPQTFIVGTEAQMTRCVNVLKRLPLDEKTWEVSVSRWHPKRSVTANRRLWALHQLAAEHTGYSAEEMHEHALCKHFGFNERQVTDLFTGEITVKRIPLKRSSALDTKEFAKFMEATESWYISEWGIFLGNSD